MGLGFGHFQSAMGNFESGVVGLRVLVLGHLFSPRSHATPPPNDPLTLHVAKILQHMFIYIYTVYRNGSIQEYSTLGEGSLDPRD